MAKLTGPEVMSEHHRIAGVLIVGGGYAGLHAAKAVADMDVPVTILDAEGVHGFTTRLAAVAGGSAPPGDAFAPLEAFGHSVLLGRAEAVFDGSVRSNGDRTIEADAVIVTAGAKPLTPELPGLDKALMLRTPADALAIRRRLATTDRVTIIGAGATGLQLAGAIAATFPEMTVRVVDQQSKLLPMMDSSVGKHAHRVLEDRGVLFELEANVEEIVTDGVRLKNGQVVDGTVVWTGGYESVVDDLGADLPTVEGRIEVGADLRIRNYEKTFAAGDVATHRDRRGDVLPMAAQVAVQAGAAAGSNAARLARGIDLEAATLSHRGWVVDLGGLQGVAQIGPIPLAAPLLDRVPPILHHAIDLKHLMDVGGPTALRFSPGCHQPADETLDRFMNASTAGAAS